MGIYVTGDIHGKPVRLGTESFYEQKEFSGNKEDNYVIILGDFGLVWNRDTESKQEKWWLDWLQDKPFTTLFVDGNHENHIRLNTYPVKEWNGGKVHKIRPNVLHLMRGEVFNIEDKKFFVMGGASSHDIQDGILDYEDPNWKEKAKKLDSKGKYMYRIKGLSWWSEEIPSDIELGNGLKNLEKHNYKVDYILSHSPSTSQLYLLGGKGLYEPDKLSNYLEEIRVKTEYRRHFMGHMHVDKAINDKDIVLYEQIVRIV